MIGDLHRHPRRTLAELIQRGRPHLDAAIDVLVDSRVWTRSRRPLRVIHPEFADCDASTYSDALETLTQMGAGRIAPYDTRHAVLGALVVVLNLTTTSHRRLNPAPEVLLAACGELSWIVRDVTTHLYDAQALDIAAGVGDGATAGAQFGAL